MNLALALIDDPPLLLLDEPYAGFDLATYERFTDWLGAARRAGKTILLVTHLAIEKTPTDRLLTLAGGALRCS